MSHISQEKTRMSWILHEKYNLNKTTWKKLWTAHQRKESSIFSVKYIKFIFKDFSTYLFSSKEHVNSLPLLYLFIFSFNASFRKKKLFWLGLLFWCPKRKFPWQLCVTRIRPLAWSRSCWRSWAIRPAESEQCATFQISVCLCALKAWNCFI